MSALVGENWAKVLSRKYNSRLMVWRARAPRPPGRARVGAALASV